MRYKKLIIVFIMLLFAPKMAFAVGFSASELKSNLETEIEKKLDLKNITLEAIKVQREGSGKIFTLEQVEDAKIAGLLKITSLKVKSETFNAEVSEVSNKFKLIVRGNMIRSVKIPVLSENISKETEITQDHIELIDIPEKSLKPNTIIEIQELLKTVASRNLSKGVQISETDIKKPTIIKRNDVVQAIYQVKNMEVKTLAIAQKDASVNDIISFKNFDSSKVFDAKVNAEGKAIVNFEEKEIILQK